MFTIGQIVSWESQSGGFAKKKVGMIIEIVPAGQEPKTIQNCGLPRKHESYVVHVKGHGRYWPRVKNLNLENITCKYSPMEDL